MTADHSTITLGHGPDGALRLDLATLITTRGFITASSGQGKSWLIRLLVERIANRAQVILIDPEGEYPSLREKLPMLLVGEGGELGADMGTARLLARKLVELKLSAVIDLYALGDWDERRRYVAEFLTGLMNVPKALYHPIIVAIDEAHQFAPKAEGGATKNDPGGASRRAVNALMSAGRKRGFCGILASQRISKIHNDSIADAKNRFIGGITLDSDQLRAADELGIPKAERIQLRDLEPGEFYCYGPGLPKGVHRFRTDSVATSHPQPGQHRVSEVPPAPDAIKKLVAELGDLPKEARAEADELAVAQRQVADLQRQLRTRPTQTQMSVPEKVVERVEVTVFRDGEVGRLEAALAGLREVAEIFAGAGEQLVSTGEQFRAAAGDVTGALQAATGRPAVPVRRPDQIGPAPAPRPAAKPSPHVYVRDDMSVAGEARKLTKAERSILTVLIQRGARTKRQVAVQTGYAVKGGGFNNAVSALSAAGYITRDSDNLEITNSGAVALGKWEPLPAGADLITHWLVQLSKAERSIFEVLTSQYPRAMTKEQVAEVTGYQAAGGGFNNALSRLRTLELITGNKELQANAELFNE
jgi:hypothetical protein